ncbi:UNKNOWN [Stylonychia lemnae]|uniref:Uncharacterized protein n=1 Tax=Stylonychia lemnae TaxID=5949 RepID=A0A077ZSK6_STYLE|nr:UNKNOWN [Stylonychia lemnae]|eukprot:CDW72847.1 UNKNOWN [Stylonychia lemnae]
MQPCQTQNPHKLLESMILQSATLEDVNSFINSHNNELNQSWNHELKEEFERATKLDSLTLVEQYQIIKDQALASQILTPYLLVQQSQDTLDFGNLGLLFQNYSQDQNMDSITSDDDPLESTHGSYTQPDSESQSFDKQQVHKKSHNKTRTDTIWKKTLRAFRLFQKNQFLKIIGRKLTPAQFQGSPSRIHQQIAKLDKMKNILFDIQGDSYTNLLKIYYGIYGNTHNSQDRVQFFNDDLNKILFERWMTLYFDDFIENLPQGKYFKDELINFLKDLTNYNVSYRLSHKIKQMTSNGPKKRGRPCKSSPSSSEKIETNNF